MRPHLAMSMVYTVIFILLLVPFTIWLATGSVSTELVWTFVLVTLGLWLIGRWMYSRSGVVKVIRPYARTGFGNFLVVLGVLVIFAVITMFLMNHQLADPLLLGGPEGLRLPGLHKLLPVIGVLLIVLGLWVNQSDKRFIKLDHV